MTRVWRAPGTFAPQGGIVVYLSVSIPYHSTIVLHTIFHGVEYIPTPSLLLTVFWTKDKQTAVIRIFATSHKFLNFPYYQIKCDVEIILNNKIKKQTLKLV